MAHGQHNIMVLSLCGDNGGKPTIRGIGAARYGQMLYL